MKNPTAHYLTAFTFACALAPFASAQVAGAANTAVQASQAASVAARAATLPPAATNASAMAQNSAALSAQQAAAASSHAASSAASANAQMAATNAAQASAASRSPATTGVTATGSAAATQAGASIPQTAGTVNAGVANSTTVHGNLNPDENAGVAASTNAAGNTSGHAAGMSAQAGDSEPIAASLNIATTVAQIRSASASDRATISSQIQANIKSTHVALTHLRRDGRELKGEARAEFNTAFNEVHTRELAVREDLRALQHTRADSSAEIQSRLATDYQAYADAIAQAEAKARVSATAGQR